MGKHGFTPLLARLLKDDVFLHGGHALARRQIGMHLALCHVLGVVPLGRHKVVPVSGIAEDGVKFRPGVSARPRDEFAINYNCLLPLRKQQRGVKVPPEQICFSANQDLDQ